MSATGYENQEFVDQVHNQIQGKKQARREEAIEADSTRRSLENRPTTEPDEPDEVLETEPADDEDGDSEGDGLSFDDLAEPYRMREDRYVGHESMTIDGTEYRIGNPNIAASEEMNARLEAIDNPGTPQWVLTDYLLATIAEWTVDDALDEDYWRQELAVAEAITLHNTIAMGGNSRLM